MMAGPGDADDRADLSAQIEATCARIEEYCATSPPLYVTADMIAEFRDKWVPHVREIQTAALDFDALFMPRFFCRTCGPTNRIVGGSEGFVCVVCQQAATYRIMSDCGLGPGV